MVSKDNFFYINTCSQEVWWEIKKNEQKGAIWGNLAKISHGFSCVEREDVILFLKFSRVKTKIILSNIKIT